MCETLWLDVLSLLEFDVIQINNLKNFEETLKFYTEQFYILDSALRRLYSEFLNEKEIIQPFQEYYNDILIQFLDKWYVNYGGYQENQTGFIETIIDNSHEKCAIIIGDGLSYEISKIVSEKLKGKYKIDCGFKLG